MVNVSNVQVTPTAQQLLFHTVILQYILVEVVFTTPNVPQTWHHDVIRLLTHARDVILIPSAQQDMDRMYDAIQQPVIVWFVLSIAIVQMVSIVMSIQTHAKIA